MKRPRNSLAEEQLTNETAVAKVLAVDETATLLLHLPLPAVGVSTVMERERQQNDRNLADGGGQVIGLTLETRPDTIVRRKGTRFKDQESLPFLEMLLSFCRPGRGG